MSRSKTRRHGGEYDQLDRLKHENSKLKREVSRLRKLLDRADYQVINNIKEVAQQQRK